MHRILFVIPIGQGVPVFGYGLFLMIGFAVGILTAWLRAKKRGLPPEAMVDVGLWAVVAGVLGARLAFLLIDYNPDPTAGIADWFAFWKGGLTFQGGLFLAILVVWLYVRRRGLSWGKVCDAYAPGLAAGIGFGRLGCLLNGCCWGKPAPAGFPLGMVFPPEAEVTRLQQWNFELWPGNWNDFVISLGYPSGTQPPIALYPTQIISALGLFAIAGILLGLERRYPGHRNGQVMLWFIYLYSIGRFMIEFLRDDTPLRGALGAFPGLRLGQWMSVGMFVAALLLQWFLSRRGGRESGPV